MTRLYVVTSGEYSDYRVDAIFDDKAIAEQWMAIYGGNDIEEYTLNPGVKEMSEGLRHYMVWIERGGNCRSIDVINPEKTEDDARMFWGRGMLRVITWAAGHEHAVKIANEKRAQLLANNMWRDDGGFGLVEVVPNELR